MTKIVVIGAGVIGLTTALELLKDPTNQVTIVAKQFPTDFEHSSVYTSPIAGANWLSFADDDDTFTQNIDKVGYKKYRELIKNAPEAGVTPRTDITYVTKEKFEAIYKGVKTLPWYCKGEFSKVVGFRELDPSEYNTSKIAYAYQINGLVVRTSYYMTYLINEMWKLTGGFETPNSRFSLRRGSVTKLSDAYSLHHLGTADLVINCTGLLSRELEDIEIEEKRRIYPVRGIVFVAENTTGMKCNLLIDIFDPKYPDEKLYFMPRREGELIMGGVFQENEESKVVDPTFIVRMITRCKKYLSQYNWDDLKIVRTQVGYRPFRKGGYRIERVGKVIHCYGVGAAGFQSSWGCAERVVGLVNQYKSKSKL